MTELTSPSGLRAKLDDNGTLHTLALGDIVINLFVGSVMEGGPTNLVLRRHAKDIESTPLLGPRSPTRWYRDAGPDQLEGAGVWQGLRYRVALRLAAQAPAWFWHLRVENAGTETVRVDLLLLQDLGLAPYGALRMNEYYVSQYLDHVPLEHAGCGIVIASRQNQGVGTRHPWCIVGSLNRAVGYGTDALQVHGLAARAGALPPVLADGLPSLRLQHEHAMAALQDGACELAPGAARDLGWFGRVQADHPQATSIDDLAAVAATLALNEAHPPAWRTDSPTEERVPNLFTTAAPLAALDFQDADLDARLGHSRRHVELDAQGRLLAFFQGNDRHVVLRAKELAVLRPHGHLLRTGRRLVPDESALTSTTWMGGVFHSMLTQGHVSLNRCLSTVRSYLGLFRAQGLRVFVEAGGAWRLLDQPSAFEMWPDGCRWLYRHAGGLIEVCSEARSEPHALGLDIDVVEGMPTRFLVCLHVALDGDDGSAPGRVNAWREGPVVVFGPAAASDLAKRFPNGHWRIEPSGDGTTIERLGGDELLFSDGATRELPYLVLATAVARTAHFTIVGRLIEHGPDVPVPDGPELVSGRLGPGLTVIPRDDNATATRLRRLVELLPWLRQNALVHYLAPRGLEQFSGGGWGTRDVCQGPMELLLAHGHGGPMRELLLRVMKAQQTDGDWPQWFMFFERDAGIRAADSHGDIVFWPLLALAQYLLSSGDASILDEPIAFVPKRAASPGHRHPVWEHVLRALALTRRRLIPGTALATYGHGDWNDALQPADPAMRENMCSAWTVTLHHQTLTTLARALRQVGRQSAAQRLERQAEAVRRDFLNLLLVDDVLAGYAVFEPRPHARDVADSVPGGPDRAPRIRYLLHPCDTTTGVRYSVLAMIHAILESLFDRAQLQHHLRLIDEHMTGPDGARLFDRPLPYHGGLQRNFQRAESASFFGREIGLMYMHAHLRYAQALAHVGQSERFLHALCQANPIGLREIVPNATLRQSNCYYSSSDAKFDDRYQANEEYERVRRGTVDFDGGWRVYSSGPGILYSLIVRHLLGLRLEADALLIDPVLPPALDGLCIEAVLLGQPFKISYRVRGPGCGVVAMQLDGAALDFAEEVNPYRRGAARVALAKIAGVAGNFPRRRLDIEVGP